MIKNHLHKLLQKALKGSFMALGVSLFGFLGLMPFLARPAFADSPLVVLEKEVDLGSFENKNQLLINEEILFRHIKRREIDIRSLENLTEATSSFVYSLKPKTKEFTLREAKVNLYRRDFDQSSDYQINLKISKQITLESRTRLIDTLLSVSPFEKEINLSVGHQFEDRSSLYTFFDPIRLDILTVFSKPLAEHSELNFLAYFDPRDQKTEFFGSIKFLF